MSLMGEGMSYDDDKTRAYWEGHACGLADKQTALQADAEAWQAEAELAKDQVQELLVRETGLRLALEQADERNRTLNHQRNQAIRALRGTPPF